LLSLSASVDLPGGVVYPDRDWLFERMAESAQGWHIRSDTADVWPTPDGLDLAVIQAARAVVKHGGRLAVAVPRVVTGVALGPLVYVALNGLIQGTPYASQPGFIPFPLPDNKYLAIASRSHAVRDLLGESLVKFGARETRLCQFPTYRLTRTGVLEEGVYGRLPKQARPRPAEMVKSGPSIIVYDYWPLPSHSKTPHIGAVVAELGEQDSLETVERLDGFLRRAQPRCALAIVNVNDVEKCRRLTALGFHLIVARTSDRASGLLAPSFAGIDRAAPRHVEVAFDALLASAPASVALADAFQSLAEASGRVPKGEPYPLALRRAWYVFDHLATCPLPLASYEILRRRDPREQTLRFRLDKLHSANWSLIQNPSVRGMLMTRWDPLVDLLRSAYDALLADNPKWWRLAEMILDADAPLGVLLPSRLAAQGLRDELLIQFGWHEFASPVRVRSLAEARRGDECFDRVTLPGNWKDWQRALIFGALPREVRVVGYPYEACVLDKRLRAMRHELEVTIPERSMATFARLVGSHAATPDSSPSRALTWDTTAVATARAATMAHWDRRRREQEASETREEDDDRWREDGPDLTWAVASLAERGEDLSVDDEGADESVPAVTLSFDDGTALTVRRDRELLVLPRDTEVTEQRFAETIAPGDRVLVFSSGEQHDVFATTLARTQHLLKTDARIVERWQGALVTIRRRFPPGEWGAGTRFAEALRGLGCLRDPATMRTWLAGSTMAPRAVEDIAAMLRLAGDAAEAGLVARWSALISGEMNHIRDFNRRLGRRIVRRMLNRGSGDEARDRIDEEIDELLEDALCWPLRISVRVEHRFALTRGGATLRQRVTHGYRNVAACTR